MSQKKLNNEELETRLQFYKLKAEHLEKQLAEKDKEIEELKANQTPTDKELSPLEYGNYNLADKLRYKESQIHIARERLEELEKSEDYVIIERNFYNNLQEQLTEMKQIEEMLKQSRHQVCEEIRDLLLEKINPKFIETRYSDWIVILKTLDKIEKGESKC